MKLCFALLFRKEAFPNIFLIDISLQRMKTYTNSSFLFLSISFVVIFGSGKLIYSQSSITDSALSIPMFYATYAFHFPGGDMSERYGTNSSIGGGFQWKTSKNWIAGGEFLFLFGNNVKIADQIMFNLKTSDGDIINMAGNFTNYAIFERGFYINGRFGKLFSVLGPNPNSGLVIMGSLGYLQHKIRIEVEKNTAPPDRWRL